MTVVIIFSLLHIFVKQIMLRRSWWWNRRPAQHPSRGASLPMGWGYSWAEFESYYFDTDMAAEIWEAAEVAAAPEPISPRFEPGSIVRVLADTTPGVHPMHAEGILVAKVLDFAFEGHYFERLTWFGLLNFSSPYLYLFVFKCKKKLPRMNNPSTELTFIPPLCLVI